MNEWVRAAAEHADISYQGIADRLTAAGVGSYDRSIVQKMTVARGVKATEAAAISEITGYPLPDFASYDLMEARFLKLSPEDQRLVADMIDRLLTARVRRQP